MSTLCRVWVIGGLGLLWLAVSGLGAGSPPAAAQPGGSPVSATATMSGRRPLGPRAARAPVSDSAPQSCAAWSAVPSPNQGGLDNFLSAVAAVAANDVWAVGYYDNGSTALTLTEHWNGAAWTIVPSPSPGASNELWAVTALAHNNVWAVGGSDGAPLIEHWDGTHWSVVPSPSNIAGAFSSIAAVAAADIWAVGTTGRTPVEHWNGSAWSVVPRPSPASGYNELRRVAARAANDVWAVGSLNNGAGPETLIEHWNGSAWAVVPSPNGGADANHLWGVTALTCGPWAITSTPAPTSRP